MVYSYATTYIFRCNATKDDENYKDYAKAGYF